MDFFKLKCFTCVFINLDILPLPNIAQLKFSMLFKTQDHNQTTEFWSIYQQQHQEIYTPIIFGWIITILIATALPKRLLFRPFILLRQGFYFLICIYFSNFIVFDVRSMNYLFPLKTKTNIAGISSFWTFFE